MNNIVAQKKLYDHFPPGEIFLAVASDDPGINNILAAEIFAATKAKPTQSLITFYRNRIIAWLRIYGLNECRHMSNDILKNR